MSDCVGVSIAPDTRKSLIQRFNTYYRVQLASDEQPNDSLLGRLLRERETRAYTVIDLAKVSSFESQSVTLDPHDNLPDQEPLEGLNVARFVSALRILYNGYAVVGLEQGCLDEKTGRMVPWCTWHCVKNFVDMLANIVASRCISSYDAELPLRFCQRAELEFRTRLMELLRATSSSGTPITFDEAFHRVSTENQDVLHEVSHEQRFAQSAETTRNAASCSSSKRTATSSMQKPNRKKICVAYNTTLCHETECNAIHCCDVVGCGGKHARFDHPLIECQYPRTA